MTPSIPLRNVKNEQILTGSIALDYTPLRGASGSDFKV